jgi:hypothetical protein
LVVGIMWELLQMDRSFIHLRQAHPSEQWLLIMRHNHAEKLAP